ncbi:MAG: hypothetical protein K6E18_07030 [Lachnospiraceae bacterium]|nr:hypothetical protein [Lachnospiraceae bacterium]
MVSIDICQGLWGKVSIINKETKEQLWEGKSGETAEFPSAPTMPIAIIWGIIQTPNVIETVTDGSDYELVFRMKPFKSEYYLVEKKMVGEDDSTVVVE